MLTIRFNRIGKRNRAQFRIVVQEHTVAPGGRHVEIVGSYNPHSKEGIFEGERIKYWMEKGAQISDSVYNLLVAKEVISGKKRAMNIRSKRKGKKGEKKIPGTVAPADKQENKAAEGKPEEIKKEEAKAGESEAGEKTSEARKEAE